MRSKSILAALVILAAASGAVAQTSDPLASGGWEFGGTLKFSHAPDHPIFTDDVTEEERGEFSQITDVSVSVGRFLADRFSLALRPSMLLVSQHNMNSSLEKSIDRTLFLGLGVEPSWYFPVGSSWILGAGAELGIGFWPGLPGLDDDVEDSDHSLDIQVWLEPKVRVYYRVSDLLAPYAEVGYRMAVLHDLRDSFGDPVAGGFFDEEVRGRFAFTLGLKYFLPQGARFAETGKAPYNDVMDILVSAR